MTISRASIFGLVLGGMLLLGSDARAVEVRYTTIGTFTGGDLPPGSTYLDAASGVVISFQSAIDDVVNVPPASQASFGTFNTSLTTATTFRSVSAGFTLDIFQTAPSAGELSFVGSLSGQLFVQNSQAFVRFNQPLVGTIGLIVYQIVSADDNTPGRINLAPPTTNAGLTTIAGRIDFIPEPSTMILVGMGALAPLGLSLRRRLKA